MGRALVGNAAISEGGIGTGCCLQWLADVVGLSQELGIGTSGDGWNVCCVKVITLTAIGKVHGGFFSDWLSVSALRSLTVTTIAVFSSQ